jgi:hypothetical protein
VHRTTVWLSHEDDELLREVAFRTRRTKSDLIREAVRLIGEQHMPATRPEVDDIVSPRVPLAFDDWIFSPTEDAVISLRNARLSPAAIAEDLALTEAQVLVLQSRIDAKLASMRAPTDPLSLGGT